MSPSCAEQKSCSGERDSEEKAKQGQDSKKEWRYVSRGETNALHNDLEVEV